MQGTADRDRTGRRERPRIVIVGGGFAGVEVAGEIGDFLKASRRWYPQGDVAPGVVIVHGGAHLFPELPERLGRFIERTLGQGGGVEIRLNTRSRAVDPRGVVLDDGTRIDAATVVCTIGTRPNPLGDVLPA